MMEVMENKGFKGYMLRYTRRTKVRWVCSSRVTLSCKGALTTDVHYTDAGSTFPYKHGRDGHRRVAAMVITNMMEQASSTRHDLMTRDRQKRLKHLCVSYSNGQITPEQFP